MGLQSQLNDVSSDSIPLLLLALIAKSIDHLRCLLFSLFHILGLSRFTSSSSSSSSIIFDDTLFTSMGSGLGGLIVLAEQLNINRVFSYNYTTNSTTTASDDFRGSDCVVCLCALREGDRVRKLDDCRHVFHKECFDGWLHHLNFNCPLCRSPIVSDERVDSTRSRVGGDLVQWFSFR